MKETGFYGYIYNFSVDYEATAIDDILDIQQKQINKKIFNKKA